MKTCLLRLLVFLVLLPVVFALFCFITYTVHFYRRERT